MYLFFVIINTRVKILESLPQLLLTPSLWLHDDGLEVDWQAIPQHGLNENSESLHMNPGGASLTKVDLQPSDQRTELVLLVLLQGLDLLVLSLHRLLVILEVSDDVLALATLHLEGVNYLLEQGDVDQDLLAILVDLLGRAWDHVFAQGLVVDEPLFKGMS